jgi:hypothetical protein
MVVLGFSIIPCYRRMMVNDEDTKGNTFKFNCTYKVIMCFRLVYYSVQVKG